MGILEHLHKRTKFFSGILKWRTPQEINLVGIVIGVLCQFLAYACATVDFLSQFQPCAPFISGFGFSLIAGAILNIIAEWRAGNLLMQTVMNGIYETTANAREIRHDQSIKFVIKEVEHESEKYLHFLCTHGYKLINENRTSKKIDVNTFHNISIPRKVNEDFPEEYKTQFLNVKIQIGDEPVSTHDRDDERYEEEFGFDEYGRPSFATKGLRLSKKDKSITVTYEISSVYKLKSSHFWYFQEISDGVTLIINNQTEYPVESFFLVINHPNRDEIESHNRDSMNFNGELIPNFSKKYSTIDMNCVFFPYQGFELRWDLTGSEAAPGTPSDNS